jgi:IS5 family transposase
MKPDDQAQDDLLLFQAHFDQLLNPTHPLIKLAKQFDWEHFEKSVGELYCPDNGAPALPTRLMVGLHYLKHAFNASDESVVERWVENPYWQYFCGYTHMQHRLPIHPTSLTRWRQRIGEHKLAELLQYTIDLAVGNKHIQRNELAKVNVDTTVQEKNITTSGGRRIRSCCTRRSSSLSTLPKRVASRCDSHIGAWANVPRSWSAVTHMLDNSNACAANCVGSKRMSAD